MGNYTRQYYHSGSNRPEWRSNFQKHGAYFGIELEVEPRAGHSYASILAAMPDVGARRPLTETDASLSDQGVEIIFPPIMLGSYKNKNSVFRKVLAGLDGNTHFTNRCGMHTSVNRNGWTDEQACKFVALINNMPVTWLTNIGGRSLNQYCQQLRWLPLPSYRSLTMHRYAAEASPRRIECRFPGATTDHKRITNLIEFLTAVRDFVFNHPDKWIEPTVTAGPYTAQYDYAAVLQNFVTYMLSSKQLKKIGSILHNGYPRTT